MHESIDLRDHITIATGGGGFLGQHVIDKLLQQFFCLDYIPGPDGNDGLAKLS